MPTRIAASGLPPERLELEITEMVLTGDSEATLTTLYQLRDLGVRIAMDDFGTGYSSLSYLQSFPFDKIKIDRSFVKDIADGVGSLNIVRAVTAMAQGLGMTTTAEGVETNEQLEMVQGRGLHGDAGLPVQPAAAGRRGRQAAGRHAEDQARQAARMRPDQPLRLISARTRRCAVAGAPGMTRAAPAADRLGPACSGRHGAANLRLWQDRRAQLDEAVRVVAQIAAPPHGDQRGVGLEQMRAIDESQALIALRIEAPWRR